MSERLLWLTPIIIIKAFVTRLFEIRYNLGIGVCKKMLSNEKKVNEAFILKKSQPLQSGLNLRQAINLAKVSSS